MEELNRLFDDKYNVIGCQIEKGFKNKYGMQIIIKIGDIEVGSYWFEYNRKSETADRSNSRTGGKPAYCMIIESELSKLINNKEKPIDLEILGYVWALIDKTSWHTGVLKYKRKKTPIGFNDLMDIFGKGKTKTASIIGELKKYEILSHDSDGYKLSRSFIKKGGKKIENK